MSLRMKNILLPMLGVALSLSAHAQVLYSTSFETQEDFDQFTVIDANNDGYTWKFSSAASEDERTYYSYNSSDYTISADDWLISPAITPTVSGQYLVSYMFKGSSYVESMKVYYGDKPTIEALSQNLVGDYPSAMYTQYTDYFFVDAKAGEPFYIAFYACSQANAWRLYAQDLTVKMVENPVDLAVTEIVSPVSGENLGAAEKVTLRLANHGLAEAAAGSYTVDLSVDGESKFVETIDQAIPAGGEIEVTLATPVDLSISHHTYTLVAEVNYPDDISSGNNTLQADVRHIGPAVEPYTMGFETSEDTSDIKVFNLNEDDGYWSIQVNGWWVSPSRTGVRSLCYNFSSTNQADDWAILDGITMEAGYHALKYWISTMDDTHHEAYSVYWGTEATPEAMTNKIAEYTDFTQAAYKQNILIFELDQPQTVYIGFHATSPANQNWIAIDDIEVNSISANAVELGVTSVSNPPETGYVPERSNHDVVYTIMNKAVKDAEGTVILKIDDEVVLEETVTLVAQVEQTYTKENLLANLAPGNHTFEVSIYNSNDETLTDNSITVPFVIVGTPAIFYDFEDAKVPTEFTIRSEDSNTLADDAIAEFGETGVGIMNIDEHQYYGKHMLGVSSWFTEDGYADRWIVFPLLTVNSADAIFIVNSGSASEYIDEHYSVMVSKDNDKWYDYETLFSVSAEDYLRKNRGGSLAAYVGKNVYIAIHVTTYDGDCLSLDNIGITGCSYYDGVGDITIKEGDNFIFDGDILSFGNIEAVDLCVYNPNGQLVFSATGNNFSLANLKKGIYILQAKTAKGVITTKVVK